MELCDFSATLISSMEVSNRSSKIVAKTEREVRKKWIKFLEKLKRVELQEFTNYLHSPWRILWANFLAGTARGLGFILGVALVLTIVGLF